MSIKSTIKMKWQEQSLKRKMRMLVSLALVIIILSVALDMWTIKLSMLDFRYSLSSNEKVGNVVTCLENESAGLEAYVKGKLSREDFAVLAAKTDLAIAELPYDYAQVGEERFAWTVTIQNAHAVYREKCNDFLLEEEKTIAYVKTAYKLYDMQAYLLSYAHTLMTLTTEALNSFYQERFPNLVIFAMVFLAIAVALLISAIQASHVMNKTFTQPVVKLVDASKRIAKNDFYFDDIQVSNKDEIGELVRAFNKMKYATGKYIQTLEDNRVALDRLHAEELEKKEFENQIERMKLEVLRNQVNPHFLFNTLNVISGMASLEDAEVTEKMIKALSSLFRYNLRTSEKENLLSEEIQVVKDYMYLQKMRFGDRIQFEIDCPSDLYNVYVPSFALQPIVENCIVHGLAKKEEGGSIFVKAEKLGEESPLLILTISDTGVGMDEDELAKVRERLTDRKDIHTGIGVGNIYRRISLMYPNSSFEMDSEKGVGTTTRISIPFKRED